MSYENPTVLRIGMHADLGWKDFRLIGRVVMGVEMDGETYYWNEFNLQADDGTPATLVFEGTGDGGGEWRLFQMFEPEHPMTAADAATKAVGDALNLNGTDVWVTLVQTSRVYRVEGMAPEGVNVGSTANYFNAEADQLMQVVSWTGDEVEYYNGLSLSREAVELAFNVSSLIPAKIFSSYDSYPERNDYGGMVKTVVWVGVLAFFFFAVFGHGLSSCSMSREAAPVKRMWSVAPPLPIGATGVWNDKKLSITTHAAVEIDKVNAIYQRNEYLLSDGKDGQFLLVCDDSPGVKNWTLFTLIDPLTPPTPPAAGAQKIGDVVNVNGVIATVSDLFESSAQTVEDISPSNWRTGEVYFNYLARSDYETLLVRWNNSGLSCYDGKTVPAKAFADAFALANKP